MEEQLGKRIGTARKDRGLTAQQLAEQLGTNAAYLRQIECGVKTPSVGLLVRICNALQVSPDYLPQDLLVENEVSEMRVLDRLWHNTPPSKQKMICTMLQALLEEPSWHDPCNKAPKNRKRPNRIRPLPCFCFLFGHFPPRSMRYARRTAAWVLRSGISPRRICSAKSASGTLVTSKNSSASSCCAPWCRPLARNM